MFRTARIVLATAVLAGSTLVSGVQPALAGCFVNVTYVNNRNNEITIDLTESKVKMRISSNPITGEVWGTWARLTKSVNFLDVAKNSSKQRTYEHDFGCNKYRRYRFHIDNGPNNNLVIYKPSATGKTKSTNITVTIN